MKLNLKSDLFKLSVSGFIFVCIIGTLSHFVYEWTGKNTVAALFCPVNESPWEHLKLIFFPYAIWAIIQLIISQNKKGILFSKCVGVYVGMIFILSFFYTYTGIIGRNIDFLNIISFFIGVFLAFLIDYVLIKSGKCSNKATAVISALIMSLTAAIFFLFTFAPPMIPLFKDPISLQYGI